MQYFFKWSGIFTFLLERQPLNKYSYKNLIFIICYIMRKFIEFLFYQTFFSAIAIVTREKELIFVVSWDFIALGVAYNSMACKPIERMSHIQTMHGWTLEVLHFLMCSKFLFSWWVICLHIIVWCQACLYLCDV